MARNREGNQDEQQQQQQQQGESGGENVEAGTPNSPRGVPGQIGTGAPSIGGGAPAPDDPTNMDANQELAREEAHRTHKRKEQAGEKTGEAPPEPVSMSARMGAGLSKKPSSQQPKEGTTRVRVKSRVYAGDRLYEAGQEADVPNEDLDALEPHIEKI